MLYIKIALTNIVYWSEILYYCYFTFLIFYCKHNVFIIDEVLISTMEIVQRVKNVYVDISLMSILFQSLVIR
jgi:hypothetical protein